MAAAIACGVRAVGAEADLMPAADGGEGTTEVLLGALGGELRSAAAHDPLGRPIEASFALLDLPGSPAGSGPSALVEVALASGLGLVAERERDAEAASTVGTGELIAAALAAGAQRILVAAGGSATTDGGAGAIEALREAGGTGGAKLEVICDVAIPFERAAEVFGPQKGADPAAVGRLTRRLTARAGALARDPRGRAMTGAAGGLAGGLWAEFGARLLPGAAYVLGLLGFERRLERAGAAITGEGRLDAQSLEGKLVGEIARRCRDAGQPLYVVAGELALTEAGAERLGAASLRRAGTIEELERAGAELAAGG